MGRKDRERRERIQKGDETSIRDKIRGKSSADDKDSQIEQLHRSLDNRQVDKAGLRNKIVQSSTENMLKVIRELKAKGEKPTVKKLTGTLVKETRFMDLCEKLDLDAKFFDELAGKLIDKGGDSTGDEIIVVEKA